MCCATLTVQETTMATTQLMRAAVCEVCWPRHEEARAGFRPPRMNWVVVTDENHNRRMQMRWAPPVTADGRARL